VLKVPATAIDRTVVQVDDGSYSVINQTWRFIKRKNGDEELYKVDVDPNEWTNLATNAEYAAVKKELMAYLPTAPAAAAKSIKARNLRRVFKGDTYYWLEKQNNTIKRSKK